MQGLYFIFLYLQELDLYSNEIRQINATAFSGLPNLSKLVLEANLLIVPPLLTFIRTSLTYLDMSQNNITYIPRFYFYGCSELKFLFLGSNKLSMMPNLEYVAGTIQIIGLSVNQIVDVKAFYGNQYSRLRRLDLNGNNLTKFCLPSRVFSPLLEAILLHENKLTTIQLPKDFHHTDLHLRDNPWHCDQFLSWVRQCSLARFHLKCPGYVALDLLTCKSPAKLKGMPAYLGKTCKYFLYYLCDGNSPATSVFPSHRAGDVLVMLRFRWNLSEHQSNT